MLVVYFGFILTIAFTPHWLAMPLSDVGGAATGV
ncbi:MAG: hypothetical protein ISR48_04705 [Alphaproteobacteria bacterium]|nr:hypothetical protein [Alphaproteobacteria bacterium]